MSLKSYSETLYELMKRTMEVGDELVLTPENQGCTAWMDDHYDNAWSKAITRLECAFSKSLETGEARFAEAESAVYLATLKTFMGLFQGWKVKRQAEAFFAETGS